MKPHHNVTRDTICRWIRTGLTRSGTGTKIFGSHSVRSVSKAKQSSVLVDLILQKAGWSNVGTFAKFYDKKIITDNYAGVLRQ